MIESASVLGVAAVKAARGTELALVEITFVFGVVPEKVPPLADDPDVDAMLPTALAGTLRTPEEGVYRIPVDRAFEPAAAEADEENEVVAPAPVAPADPLDWMYNDARFSGCCCHSGAVSNTTWY